MNNKFELFLTNKNRLKKKSNYFRKVVSYVLELESLLGEKSDYKKLNYLLKEKVIKNLNKKSSFLFDQKGVVVLYSVFFSFSAINTFLCVTDAFGSLKFSSSAGSLNFKGKSKKNRFRILKLFFKELRKLKVDFLNKNPISLHLNNVGFFRRFIIRSLKKKFSIKIIKNYQSYSYNGCRKKKKFRK
uniref:ribosomal protein S11 n=1 Tax=Navicula tsukamotoi TaxID=2018706 RepID=UPI002027EE5E|nr:ribosomal protein S11 [Navicula tsukamotoi]QYB23100.1 ribosomal protein S11 [Navicula tsukamotoi]